MVTHLKGPLDLIELIKMQLHIGPYRSPYPSRSAYCRATARHTHSALLVGPSVVINRYRKSYDYSLEHYIRETSMATGVSESTIKRIKRQIREGQ